MAIDFDGILKDAMSALHDQRDKMLAAKRELDAATASVTSKDHMVSVTVGPQGQVVSMTFHTKAYQSMAPAELAAALVTVLNEARAAMGSQVIEHIKGFQDFGGHLRSVTGLAGTPVEMDELLKPLRAMAPSFDLEETLGEVKAAKQEEFGAEEDTTAGRACEQRSQQEEFAAAAESRIPTGKQEEFSG
ncbi:MULTISPECIES: YbaB/EbfC family nucleoid-associated protein [Streptomycetaceae]|uniref:YbaB/EbfC family nucleoid-associated protein n=1 Tax=unclassified Streptomyces TaxID=2593676 RepID=UPI003385E7C6